MRLLTAVSGVRVPQQAPESTRKAGAFLLCFGLSPLRVQWHARGQARRHAEPQWTRLRRRANNRYSVALLLTGVRVPWQAPESTRKRVLLFCFGLSPLRVQRHARGQARRHAEPQWTRLRRRANNRYSVALLLTGVEQSCQRQRQNNEPKGKRLRHFTFKIISGARACAGGDGEGEGGGGTGHAPY